MSDEIVVKKGEKFTLHCCSRHLHSDKEEEFTAECDFTEKDMDELAEQFMWDKLEPEWWWTK
jgi:hypothetical protein